MHSKILCHPIPAIPYYNLTQTTHNTQTVLSGKERLRERKFSIILTSSSHNYQNGLNYTSLCIWTIFFVVFYFHEIRPTMTLSTLNCCGGARWPWGVLDLELMDSTV